VHSCNGRLIANHVPYQMAPLLLACGDLEGQFYCLKPLYLTYLWKYSVHYLRHFVIVGRGLAYSELQC